MPIEPTVLPNDIINNTTPREGANKNNAAKVKYVDLIKEKANLHQENGSSAHAIPVKHLSYVNGVPRVTWTEEEVNKINVIENPQYAIIGKLSYGWPNLEDLRIQIPKQCKIKGDCRIGLLRNRHILIRLSHMEYFVNIMSKNMYYIVAKYGIAYQMRPLIYDAKFKSEEKTTQAMAWISFPELFPTFL